ncbi:hypothetical protein [uncultured Cytophaga sp.]|uniref:hypothetical protein n=1 Tax=uncultured Cytophaga sp. TaxID=160238 RepID=UPI00261BBBA3|nr:hypothetical protein [uncultured Cytophaga sp.]
MYNYGIGGNEVKVDASEAISDIANNKTLLVQKLTVDDTFRPEIVEGLKTVEEVFEHFKPEQSVDFETKEGSVKNESFQFGNLGDFGVKKVVEKSAYLKDLNSDIEQYTKIAKQFKSNKVLQSVAANPEMNQALIDTLSALLVELKSQD